MPGLLADFPNGFKALHLGVIKQHFPSFKSSEFYRIPSMEFYFFSCFGIFLSICGKEIIGVLRYAIIEPSWVGEMWGVFNLS